MRYAELSGEFVESHGADGRGIGFESAFDAANGFGGQRDTAANVADLGGTDHSVLSEYATWDSAAG
jgi:hypothetical protein